jgi:maleate isomerase
MDSITERIPAQAQRHELHAFLGLIIPGVNRVCEPQFNRYAPPDLGVLTTRARIAGRWSLPIEQMADEIVRATTDIAECEPDLLVYHCTGSSMKEGPKGERRILDIIAGTTDIPAVSTSALVGEALDELGLESVVVISPYPSNATIVKYLEAIGKKVVHEVALGLSPIDYAAVTPERWFEIAVENDRSDADTIFLSCANTTQIDAIAPLEAALGKPMINSNQAVLWGCLNRLRPKLDPFKPIPELGRLMQSDCDRNRRARTI